MAAKIPPMRVQKYLSAVGFSSRRKAEGLIDQGRVRVNGEAVREQGQLIQPGVDRVEVDGKEVRWQTEMVYAAVFKPARVITSLGDPEGRETISALLPRDFPRAWPVGRLDWDSDGLVIMTNDGDLTHALTHPSCHVEKIYNVKLRGLLDHQDPTLVRLREGVTLDDGFETSSAQVTVERKTSQHTWIQIILHEGRNRQIRRMAEAVGHTVLRLRRVAVGPLELDLDPGQWRLLTRAEVLALYDATGLKAPRKLIKSPEGPIIPASLRVDERSKARNVQPVEDRPARGGRRGVGRKPALPPDASPAKDGRRSADKKPRAEAAERPRGEGAKARPKPEGQGASRPDDRPRSGDKGRAGGGSSDERPGAGAKGRAGGRAEDKGRAGGRPEGKGRAGREDEKGRRGRKDEGEGWGPAPKGGKSGGPKGGGGAKPRGRSGKPGGGGGRGR